MGLKAFTVNIVGLANKVHPFEFEVKNDFFSHYGTGLFSEGSLKAEVSLDKRETFIDASFVINGSVKLICDRSLDTFDYRIRAQKKLVFKYGDDDQELSDEIVMIHRDSESLELGQYIFEFIVLEIPMKRLHPRYQAEEQEDDDSEGKIIYTSKSSEDDGNEGESIDPRWEKLRKLK
jgi:Predicted metal-binding, possibly nucleic acid-binding protein